MMSGELTPEQPMQTEEEEQIAAGGEEVVDANGDSVPAATYQAGELVWAKLKGFPWWPARVEDENDLPEHILGKKPMRVKSNCVFFFGSRDYGWFATDTLKNYAQHKDAFSKNKKTVLFKKALQEAEDPSIIEKERLEKEQKAAAALEKRDQKKEATAAKRRASTGGELSKKKKTRARSESDGEDVRVRKKRRHSEGGSKRPKVTYSDDEEEQPAPPLESETKRRKSVDNKRRTSTDNGDEGHEKGVGAESDGGRAKKKHKAAEPDGAEKHRTPSDKLLRLRARLQKFCQSEERDERDYQKADIYLREVEGFDMDYTLLRDTKIGKVMRVFGKQTLPEDPANLIGRANALVIKWKYIAHLQEPDQGDATAPKEEDGTEKVQTMTNGDEAKDGADVKVGKETNGTSKDITKETPIESGSETAKEAAAEVQAGGSATDDQGVEQDQDSGEKVVAAPTEGLTEGNEDEVVGSEGNAAADAKIETHTTPTGDPVSKSLVMDEVLEAGATDADEKAKVTDAEEGATAAPVAAE